MTTEERVATVEALCARETIADVLLRYFRGLDRAEPALVRAAFFDDATLDYGPFFRGDVDGLLALSAASGHERTMHVAANVLVDLRTEDLAHAETYVVAYHSAGPAHAWSGAFVTIHMRYLDRFERRAGRWAIARRRVVYEWVRKERTAAFEELPGEAMGRRDPADPLWSELTA